MKEYSKQEYFKKEYSQSQKLYYWLHLASTHNVSLFLRFVAAFPNLEEAFELARAGNLSAFKKFNPAFVNKLSEYANVAYIDDKLAQLEKNEITLFFKEDDEYPSLLREIHLPPPVLYVKGKLESEPKLPIAVVGTRRNTGYGETMARHFSVELVKSGATIVSGMALGIDSFAAESALNINTVYPSTIAVLGSGVDVIYPSTNARLYHRIIENGAVMSEFMPGTKPFKENFPIRNRIISGLSRGILIIEAAARSGTSITANYALEQGRDVFVIPGRITDEASVGTNAMIQKGEAKPVFCVEDILSEYGLCIGEINTELDLDLNALTEHERSIVEQLRDGAKSADEICEILALPASIVNSNLTSLQFSGIIKQLPGRMFGL